jgi:hypothetical protein
MLQAVRDPDSWLDKLTLDDGTLPDIPQTEVFDDLGDLPESIAEKTVVVDKRTGLAGEVPVDSPLPKSERPDGNSPVLAVLRQEGGTSAGPPVGLN